MGPKISPSPGREQHLKHMDGVNVFTMCHLAPCEAGGGDGETKSLRWGLVTETETINRLIATAQRR